MRLLPVIFFTLLPMTLIGQTLRVATYNASLSREAAGQLARELTRGSHPQIRAVGDVIKAVAPDILLINEFDRDANDPSTAVADFQRNYLAPLHYPHVYHAPVNTGEPSGEDLDHDGSTQGPGDALGFGAFPGQYGMLVLSKFPIETTKVRTFQHFKWKDMPGHLMPPDWYTAEQQAMLPLSSKSHWDVPIRVGEDTLHFLVCHPTPPVFDGEEDRNGRRNHDEIRLWSDYITPGDAEYLVDDRGERGGLERNALFVVAGDLNADPLDGEDRNTALKKLLAHPRVQSTPIPRSEGGSQAARRQGGANRTQQGNPAFDTGDFDDELPGNLRVDYVRPSTGFESLDARVHWPTEKNHRHPSDHRLVFVDLRIR